MGDYSLTSQGPPQHRSSGRSAPPQWAPAGSLRRKMARWPRRRLPPSVPPRGSFGSVQMHLHRPRRHHHLRRYYCCPHHCQARFHIVQCCSGHRSTRTVWQDRWLERGEEGRIINIRTNLKRIRDILQRYSATIISIKANKIMTVKGILLLSECRPLSD